ncbi:MAG: sigma-54-dependent Fis family transcriptional regulator [Deltaproteobacteria bacterium]|nr:sigma-54-dependent Fis family transcriptional regulator [Deltaproteobacteria bacterium]
MESIPDNNTPVLVVDDDEGLLSSIKTTLVSFGMPEPALLSDGRDVMKLVREKPYKLIFLDLIMPHISGMEILKQIKEEFPDIECVIVTAIDEVSSAVQAIKFGAYDYLVKPLNSEKLIIVINRALERFNLRHGLSLFERKQSFKNLINPQAFKDVITEDEAMALVFHQVESIAPTDYSVVISGESGTGKEMIARIIHNLSNRSKGPFLAVNMASFNDTLFEDEFFGHIKGAYTGAVTEKKGFFETAQDGTLFLDEITELESALQGKLLRVIQENELYRLGSTKTKNIDVRILAATNRDINKEINKGSFRADLFYRLNMCHIKIPPLRERKKDIVPLARHFLMKHTTKTGKNIVSLSPDLIKSLLEYPFPGNVREFENIIAGAILLEKGKVLKLSSVHNLASCFENHKQHDEQSFSLAEIEKQHIYKVLDITHGNRTKAAKLLEIGLRTLQRKLKLFGEKPAATN